MTVGVLGGGGSSFEPAPVASKITNSLSCACLNLPRPPRPAYKLREPRSKSKLESLTGTGPTGEVMTERSQSVSAAVFFAAARRGDVNSVASMLEQQPSLALQLDAFGKDALHYTRLLGHNSATELLQGQAHLPTVYG